MMDDFEDFGKLYDREFRKQVVSYVQQMMEQNQLYYLCMYAEDGAIAFELKGDKILRDIRFGGHDSNITGAVYNTEEIQGQRDFIERFILGTVEKHGGVNIVSASDFEKLWDKRDMNKMKEYLQKVGVGILLVIAGIMGCSTLLLCTVSFSSLLCLGFAAIILYCLIPKSWSSVGISLSIIAASLYILVMFIFMLYQPGRLLLSSLLPIMTVLALLKGKPKWMWGIVALIFLIVGVYCLLNNNIIGPMAFRICDRPVDIPAQWGHNYRLFWSFALLQMVAHLAGILSIMVMFGYSLYKKIVCKS